MNDSANSGRRLLVVDDEQSISWGVRRIAEQMGWEAKVAASAEQAIQCVGEWTPDVIVLDVRLPGQTGLDAMPQLAELTGGAPIVIMTAYGDIETAVEAVRRGAAQYIVKPFDAEQIRTIIERVASEPAQREQPASDARSEHPAVAPDAMVGDSPLMQRVYSELALAAASDAPVLVQGESGVGKELAARAIHRYSRRSDGPLVIANLAALSSTLAESELFGHVRGAFTGADQARSGLLAAADGGVLFLDEVAEIPVSTQVKLLRVLERSEWTPVGADTIRRGDFRLICATHRDLPAMVRAGEFRHDLYFRIAGFTVRIPPLRERPDDIETLVRHFLELSIQESDGRTPLVTDEAMRQLRSRAWPGNVRELRNAMERAVIVARGGPIHPEHLPESVLESDASEDSDHRSEPDADPLKHAVTAWTQRSLVAQPEAQNLYDQLMEAVEPALLATLLQRHHGRIAAVARSLGIHRTTVRKKVDHYGLDASFD